ncbi:MAG TPA: hypothetical protein VMV49_16735 [Candidatus Deferrimicrobium sp.]|nr:hypothetical protein [Candidatus Deferrimicrobium sp.]
MPEEKKSLKRLDKIMLLCLIIAPLLYLILLILFQYLYSIGEFTTWDPNLPFSINFIYLLFGLISIGASYLLYVKFIPHIKNPENESKFFENMSYFMLCFLSIAIGSSIISIFGFLIGFLEVLTYGQVPWWFVIIFFGLGTFNGVLTSQIISSELVA